MSFAFSFNAVASIAFMQLSFLFLMQLCIKRNLQRPWIFYDPLEKIDMLTKGVEKYLAIRDFQFPKMPKMAFSRFSRRCCLMSVTCQVVFLGFVLSQEEPLMFYW